MKICGLKLIELVTIIEGSTIEPILKGGHVWLVVPAEAKRKRNPNSILLIDQCRYVSAMTDRA